MTANQTPDQRLEAVLHETLRLVSQRMVKPGEAGLTLAEGKAAILASVQQLRGEWTEQILNLVPMPNHRDDCPATIAHLAQRGPYKDPIICFEDRCTCGAAEFRELSERISKLTQPPTKEAKG